MTSRTPNQCRACTRYKPADDEAKCDAFPRGIPEEILYEGADHRRRFDGDGGVRFALRDGEEAARAFGQWKTVFE